MPEDTTRTSNRRLNSSASEYNAISFIVEQMINSKVNTAIPVRVDSCTKPGSGGAAGYVSATPLVMQRGADGRSLPMVSIPKLPFFRLQCGTAAVVMDPQPGDIGLAVFAQQDSSNVGEGTKEPVQAGSFRSFDMSDGFYIGGFFGTKPDTFAEFDPIHGEITVRTPKSSAVFDRSGNITADADKNVTITAAENVTVTATESVSATATAKIMLKAPVIELDGTVRSSGTIYAPHFEQGGLI